MELSTSVKKLDRGACIVAPKGSIDSLTSEEFESALDAVLSAGPSQVLLYMRGVSYISSSGLGVLFKFRKKFEASRLGFALYDPTLSVQRVLEISKATIMQLRPETLLPDSPFHTFVADREAEKKRLAEKESLKTKAESR